MRLLNKTEQNLCDRILLKSGPDNFLGNVLDHDLGNTCINVSYIPEKASFDFNISATFDTNEEQQYIIKRAEEVSMLVLQTVNLLNMLEKEGYILLLERGSNSRDPHTFGKCIGNAPKIGYEVKDANIIRLLCDYSNKEIYATEEFVRFCDEGYIPRDEQRYRTQIKFTQIALGLTTVALIFSIYSNFRAKPEQNVKLDVVQYKEIIDKLGATWSKDSVKVQIQSNESYLQQPAITN